ncbi:MAG: S-methyl-5'-thioadenosine phosphorylase [Actinomycetota bacterium]
MTTASSDDPSARDVSDRPIGVIGGSGFYSFLEDAREIAVETPFGPPSAPVRLGRIKDHPVAFLPRHGHQHHLLPHQVNYRANLWALRSVGVRQVIAPCAVGSLRSDWGPGTLVIPDQILDRTWGRRHTIFDDLGAVVHVSLADPYCPRGRAAVSSVATASMPHVYSSGTLVVINGPRFSTRAESTWHAAAGASIVGMTGMPEAAIARELALCYTSLALVTDLDAGVEDGQGVTHHDVLKVFSRNVEYVKTVVAQSIQEWRDNPDCLCRHVLDDFTLPFELP